MSFDRSRLGPTLLLPAAGLAAALAAPAASAQCPELQRLPKTSTEASEWAGSAVGIDGNVAAVGAPGRNANSLNDSGAVDVFRFNGTSWVLETTLTAFDAATSDHFGTSVEVSGDVVAVGVPDCDALGADSGAVYVYRYNGSSWAFEKKITASDGASNDQFGHSIGLEGNNLVVGAHLEDFGSSDSGSVYVYNRPNGFVGWQEIQKLNHPSPASSDWYGFDVAIGGTTIVVGCPLDDNNSKSNDGAAFIYRLSGSTWNLENTLYSPRLDNSAYFGNGVGTDGNEVVVGSPYDDLRGTDAGAAFGWIYSSGSWNYGGELIPTNNSAFDYYGENVDVDNTVAVVAGRLNDLRGTDAGLVWSFRSHNGAYFYDQRYAASTTSTSDHFGIALAVDNNRMVVGGRYDDVSGPDSGEAYVFSVKEFVLTATPVVTTGQQLDFASYCGTPNTPCYFAVLSVNGTPFFQILFKLNFASDHRMQFSTTVPPGLAGTTIAFETFKFGAWGQVAASNVASVKFQ